MLNRHDIDNTANEIEIVKSENDSDDKKYSLAQYTIFRKIGSFIGSYSRVFEVNIVLVNGRETVEILRKGKKKTKRNFFEKSDCPMLAELFLDIQ